MFYFIDVCGVMFFLKFNFSSCISVSGSYFNIVFVIKYINFERYFDVLKFWVWNWWNCDGDIGMFWNGDVIKFEI